MAVLNIPKKEWYLEKRLNNQINYYSKKSIKYKKYYYQLAALDIIISALIPFTTLFSEYTLTKYLIALMGSFVTITSGFLSCFQFQKKWIEYRATAETLKHEKYLFKMNISPYDQDNKLDILVKNVETLISKENTKWVFYIQKQNKLKGKDDTKNG